MKKNNIEQFGEEVLKNYKKVGLDDFELSISNSKLLSVQSRNVKIENIESSDGSNITLDVAIAWKRMQHSVLIMLRD